MNAEQSVLIKNIYYMLAYAYKALQQEGFEKIGAEKFTNIHDLFAAVLVRGIEHQVKQGLTKEYLKHQHLRKTLRGKVDIIGTLQQMAKRQQNLNCEYEVLTEDNLLNRILKSAAVLLFHHGDVTQENKKSLKKVLLFFSNVSNIKPFNINWSQLSYSKGNASYQMLIYLCRLLFEGMLINKGGKVKLAKFLDDQKLCSLYEKFVLAYYQKHYPELRPSASIIDWDLTGMADEFLPKMYTDITLVNNSKILIIDTKCYSRILSEQYDKMSINSANLYQIYAYVKNMSTQTYKQVDGMLLYAKTKESIVPDSVYNMRDNKIFVRTLDLNCEFSIIKKQLDRIITENFDILRQ